MLSETVRVHLHDIGVFLSNDRASRHRGDFNPFFVIDACSEEPSKEELELLAKLTKEYRISRFTPAATRDEFWGLIANTVSLWKRVDGWRYRRMTWTDSSAWSPQSGQPLEVLFIDMGFR